MITITSENFSISQICNSGQCFRMEKIDENTYSVIALDKYTEIRQYGKRCEISCEKQEFEQFWKKYFDLETDYAGYIKKIDPDDSYLNAAASFGSGIRILRQDLWEMIVSFLISQQNNITRIRKCINNLCEKYGERKINFKGEVYYAFPVPESLSYLDEDALKECNLGYRSKYVVRTAKYIVEKAVDLDRVKEMSYQEAKEELLKLFGVGVKVADCICLFALHHLEAFPVDTHISQAMEKYYKKGFPQRRYKGFEGVMQQYIFYYELFGEKL